MTGGDESIDDDEPLPRPPGPDRIWQHPSEVGMAMRGRTDRRRSSVLATGLVLSGLGLLVTGVLMGQLPRATPTAEATSAEVAAPSLVAVTAVDAEGASRYSTGVVLDDEGHLLVPASGLGEPDHVWVRAGAEDLRRGELVGVDEQAGVAVVRVEGGPEVVGTAPRLAAAGTGGTVEVLQQTRKGVTASAARLARPPSSPVVLTAVTVAPPAKDELLLRPTDDGPVDAGPVFDERGRLVALVLESGPTDGMGAVPATSARSAFGAGADLLDD